MNGISADPYEVQEAVDVLNKDQKVSRLQKAQAMVPVAVDEYVTAKTFHLLVVQRHHNTVNGDKLTCQTSPPKTAKCWVCREWMFVAAQVADACRIALLDAVEELATVRSTIDYHLEVIRSTPSLVHCPVDTATEQGKYEEKRPTYED
jgi:hypothetical protein